MTTTLRAAGLILVVIATLASQTARAVSEFVFAGNFEAAPDCSSVGLAGCPGFAIETPSLDVPAGALIDACYAFRAPNHVAGIGRFSSVTSPLVVQYIFWQTTDGSGQPADGLAPGTFNTTCGLSSGANGRTFTWVYASHQAGDSLRMPDNDGGGQPIAFELPASAAGFLEIIYSNTTVDAATAPPVRMLANERATDSYTSTASYLGVKLSINIPPQSNGSLVSGSCSVPSTPKYWWFSTQTHIHAVLTELDRISGPTTMIQTSADWEHPTITTFPTSPFYTFSSGDTLRFACTYDNNTNATITFGQNYTSNEICMGITYLFPSNQSQLCVVP